MMSVYERKEILKRYVMASLVPVILYFVSEVICRAFDIDFLGNGEGVLYFFAEVAILFFMSSALNVNLKLERYDFSLGAVCMLSSVLSVSICKGYADVTTMLVAIVIGAVLGLVSGGVFYLTRLPFAICSLCIALIYEGLSYVVFVTNGVVNAFRVDFFSDMILFFFAATILLFLFLHIVFRKTPFGYNYKALMLSAGKNININSTHITVICYVISGILMGVVGFMLCIREGAVPTVSLNFSSVRIMFYAFVPLFFGRFLSRLTDELFGSFIGAVCGAMLFSLLESLGAPAYMQIIISSVMLLVMLIYLSNERRILKRIMVKKDR